jgi:NADH-quinone oxidoreductase subunit J
LIYLIVSLAMAVIFYLLGAPFAAALKSYLRRRHHGVVRLVVMMLNQGRRGVEQERASVNPRMWIGPTVLTSLLFSS